MSRLLSKIGIMISFLVIFTVTYLPVIQTNYFFLDDYDWIWTTHGHYAHKGLLNWYPIFIREGRFLEEYFMYIIYGSLNHFQSLDFARGLRFLGVILLSLFAYILTIIFKTNHIKTKYAFIGSILVCTLPAYQLYVSWLMGVYMILGVLLSSLASLIMFKVGINWNSTKPFYRKTAISLSIFLPVIALLIYQPTAMIYFAMAVVPLTMLTAEDLTKKWQAPFIRYFSVGFASLSIYFLIVKMVLFVKKVGVHPKGKFISLSEISERIEWFIYSGPDGSSALIHSLNLWSIYSFRWLCVIVSIIIILGFLPEFIQSILPAIRERRLNLLWIYLQRILFIIIIIPFSYLPSLVVTWKHAPFRTLIALETVVCILFFISLLNIHRFLESTPILFHNYKRMIIPILIFVLTLSVIYIAHFNVDKYIAKLQSLEIKYAEGTIQEYGISRLFDTSKIYVTECDKSYNMHPRPYNEFGILSSGFVGLTPMVKLALFNLGIKKNVEVIEVSVPPLSPEDSNVLVINCIGLKYFLDERFGKTDSEPIYLGFYDAERWQPENHVWRWSKKDGIIGIPKKGTIVELTLQSNHPDIEKDPVTVDLFLNNKPLDRVTFAKDRRVITNRYYIPSFIKGIPQIRLSVSRIWNPSKYSSDDDRDLGIAVREIEFIDEIPSDGIGFYDWEEIRERHIPEWQGGFPIRFRWTGLRASMNADNNIKDSITIFLHVAHPDVEDNPVKVEVIGDNGILREVLLKDKGWRKVTLGRRELSGTKVLTFQVDRTWNPKLVGVSNDSRDLGVAVAIPDS